MNNLKLLLNPPAVGKLLALRYTWEASKKLGGLNAKRNRSG
jgi:hypothetical protein